MLNDKLLSARHTYQHSSECALYEQFYDQQPAVILFMKYICKYNIYILAHVSLEMDRDELLSAVK